jgi:Xaa-Pro aminopeptidase
MEEGPMAAPANLLQERIERVQEALREEHGVPMLVTSPANVGWLSGVPTDFQKDAHLLVTPKRAWFITDGRYENRVPEIPGVESFIWGAGHPHRYPELAELVEGADRVAVDTKGLGLDIYDVLPQMLNVDTVFAPPLFLDRLRMKKGALELDLIREGLEAAIAAFRYMVEEWLPAHRADATDMDFRNTFVEQLMERGGEDVSFDPIVAGDTDADTPHPDMTREPTPLSERDTLLVDWGITYRGVCTDITRMIVLGHSEVPERFRELKELQEGWFAAVEAKLQPGLPAHEAGNAYVRGLKQAGIDKPFHGAGHGTGGAYVHELPRLSGLQENQQDYGIPFSQSIVLEPGMIVTNEPGMYVQGVGAWRTENMVLITEDGHEIMDRDLSLEPFFVQ